MTIKSPAIPLVKGMPESAAKVFRPIVENLEILKGRRGGRVAKLGPSATLADCLNKINEIIDWLYQ